MKFGFKPLTKKDYFFSSLFGMSIAVYGAMTATTLLGLNGTPTATDCVVLVVVGIGTFVYSMTKRGETKQ